MRSHDPSDGLGINKAVGCVWLTSGFLTWVVGDLRKAHSVETREGVGSIPRLPAMRRVPEWSKAVAATHR